MILNHDPCGGLPDSNEFMMQMHAYAKEHAIPISGTFELTPRCNFNCKMCYVHLSEDRISQFGSEMDAKEWIRLAEQARDAGMLHLCITGGEPLLHPEFETIYRAIAQMGFQITLQTNASTMSKNMLRLLDEYPPNEVKLTIYGSNNDVYRAVCGVENGFTRVDAGIRALKALDIPIVAVTTVIKQNMLDLPNIHKYTQELQIPWIYSTAVHPSLRGADTNASAVAIDEEAATDFRADVRRMMALPPRKADDKPCEHCKGFRTSFWITWDGKMRFCSFMNEPNIMVRGENFADAWQALVAYQEQLRWPAECQSCEVRDVCRMCAGSLAARSGSINRVDEAFCKKFKKYVNEEREVF